MFMKKKHESMHKMILVIAAVVAVGGICLVMVKKSGSFPFVSKNSECDLNIVNDSNDTISIKYKENGQKIAQVVQPGEKITGGKGFMRVFVAKKNGVYELTYAYPRPASGPTQVSVSQIISAGHQKNMGDEVYTEKGMLGDIKVYYEEVRDLDATY
jgi:hypothetical protein